MIRIPQEREGDFWAHQRTHRAQLVNDYAEPGPDVISPAILTVRVNRWVVGCIVLGGALWALGWLYVANAAEQPRPWIVWDLGSNKPWTSPKGYQATATGPTACNLSLHEASKASPDGTRLTCRHRKEQ